LITAPIVESPLFPNNLHWVISIFCHSSLESSGCTLHSKSKVFCSDLSCPEQHLLHVFMCTQSSVGPDLNLSLGLVAKVFFFLLMGCWGITKKS
jgi:hypothetical protein